MKEERAYTPEQNAGTERAIKILLAMPKDTRDMAAMVTSAFVEGLLAGQALKEDKDGRREVLANQ